MPDFHTPPPESSTYVVTFPAPGVLLATINRERQMNSIPVIGHWEGDAIWNWMDDEPSISVGVITGKGPKAFSAGADLLEQRQKSAEPSPAKDSWPIGGFAGISRRRGKKPIIAAVNGYAYGGGFEICLNCDIVVASPTARFALPEASRGLFAAAGGLARIVRTGGMHVASEIALTGRILSAQEAKELKFVNKVSATPDSLMSDALAMAEKVAAQSPDAIIVSRAGLREAWETGSVERASQITEQAYRKGLLESENLRIGLIAFAEKKKPKWVPSKL